MASDLSKDPGFLWSLDRIIFVKKDADFSEMSLEAFRDVRDTMKKAFLGDRELNPSELPAYRVAVVCSPSINDTMMKMFGAVWTTDPNPVVAVARFELISGALKWLGRETIPDSEFREELMDV